MAAGWRLLFHLTALLHHLVTLAALSMVDWTVGNNEKLLQISEFSDRYFTTWNFIFQVVYLTCAVLCDVGEIKPALVELFWPRHDLMRRCAAARDFLYTTVVFPCSIAVAVLFWIIYTYDRELVLPQDVDLVLPPYVNHSMHSSIVLVILLELLLGEKKKPRKHVASSMFWLGLLILVYYAVYLGTYFTTGRWIYKVFNLWNWTERAIFLVLNAVTLYVLFFIGAHAQELVEQYYKMAAQDGDLSHAREKRNDTDEKIHGAIKKTHIFEGSDVKISELTGVYKTLKTFGTLD